MPRDVKAYLTMFANVIVVIIIITTIIKVQYTILVGVDFICLFFNLKASHPIHAILCVIERESVCLIRLYFCSSLNCCCALLFCVHIIVLKPFSALLSALSECRTVLICACLANKDALIDYINVIEFLFCCRCCS